MLRQRRTGQHGLFSIAGWLFADLLLALTIIFISANTIGAKPIVKARSTPTPTLIPSPTFTPSPLPSLEHDYLRFKLTIDPNGLLNDAPKAIEQIKQQVKSKSQLQGRSAGLVVAYGGAPSVDQIGSAEKIAMKVISVLRDLGQKDHFVFFTTSYYDPLFVLYGQDTIAVIDVYLFVQ
jgi:hypothetical protein